MRVRIRINSQNHIELKAAQMGELESIQESRAKVKGMIERHKLVEDLVHRQDMQRHDLVEGMVHKNNSSELSRLLEKLETQAIASILATVHDIVPPTINHFTDDPAFDPKLNFTFTNAQRRVVNAALSNTFGFGGHNASVIFKKPSF